MQRHFALYDNEISWLHVTWRNY